MHCWEIEKIKNIINYHLSKNSPSPPAIYQKPVPSPSVTSLMVVRLFLNGIKIGWTLLFYSFIHSFESTDYK